MAENAEPQGAGDGQQEPQGTDWKAEARKWEERAKANKAKADQWDAQEEANKTEIQKAKEQAEKLKAELDSIKAAKAKADQWDAQEEANKTEIQKAKEQAEKLKAELDSIKAAKAKAEKVAKAAKDNGVNEALLARMGGDVDENAKFLKGLQESSSSYPQTRDGGEKSKQTGQDGIAQAARMLFGNRN